MIKLNCFLITILFFMKAIILCNCSGYSNSSQLVKLGCIPSERKALLQFKDSVTFHNNHVSSSWVGEDCCSWRRVKCDPTTGHVVKLHLHGSEYDDFLFEARKMESSLIYLVELNHLTHLDVSINDFNYSKIPKFLGYMKQLRYLNLSYNSYSLYGKVPPELGNLTNLQVLDLSYNDLLSVHSLKWASSLEQLRVLDLSDSNLSQAHDWISSLIGPHPFLTYLGLSGCSLPNSHQIHLNSSSLGVLHPLSVSHLDLHSNDLEGDIPPFIRNLTSLQYLDLSHNQFESQIPLWLGELTSLIHLDFAGSAVTGIEGGSIWSLIHNLCNLKYLDMNYNQLQGHLLEPRENISTSCTHFDLELLDLSDNSFISGSIGAWLGEHFRSLKSLSLSYSNISGPISNSLGMLSALENLDISLNPLEAVVLSEAHFANLTSLTIVDMSQTFLSIKLPSDWVSPFQLDQLYAGTCKLNSQFPKWLNTHKNLTYLELSNSKIQGVLPEWFYNMPSLSWVDLSNNNIIGCPTFPINFNYASLSNNSISCLPGSHRNNMYYHADSIDLSHNIISGQLPEHLYHIMPNLTSLILSNNLINGSIPKCICDFTFLVTLDLQKNKLSGTIPGCLGDLPSLFFLSLSFNTFSGDLPCFNNTGLTYYLRLNDNMLSGEIPSCLTNLSSLRVLDVGENNLSGEMPTLIVPELQILRLRNNKLKGSIPHQLCSLSNLQILDLGHNYLTGTIPYCLSNLTYMNSKLANPYMYPNGDNINEVLHGIEREYTSNLGLLVNIDLSCNKLVGSIPDGITILSYLLGLNISYNQLSGQIPRNIGGLKSLISLDLSRNKLSGSIPASLGAITSLESLDLSYNNLSGQIPTGAQLQTFNDPSIYAGNPYLCGEPLPKKCKNDDSPNNGSGGQDNQGEDNDEKRETMWFYLVVMSGVATGFWGVVGSLFLIKSWRHAYFRRVEDLHDWLYVAIAVRMAKLRNNN